MSTIKLLDGTDWAVEELLQHMLDDDFYYGYLGQSALSSSSCKLINQSPKSYNAIVKYAKASEETAALTTGKLIHTMVLEPHEFDNRFTVVDTSSKSTKIWKEAVSNKGKGVSALTTKEYDDSMKVVDALLRNEIVKRHLKHSKFEVPAIGNVLGLPFRAKADILREDAIIDLKTTSEINGFRYSALKYGYPAQVFIYCQLFNIPFESFIFIAVDKGSKDIGIFTVSEQFYEEGRQLVSKAVKTYIDFFINGEDLDNYVLTGEL